MSDNNNNKTGSVLVVGAGIGGLQSALDLADSSFKVHMIQKESSIAGTMAMLDKTFPTGDCAMCMLSPKLVEAGRHPDIDIHTMAEIISVEGDPGNYTVKVRQQPRFVDPDKCTGCGLCEEKCPKKVSSEYEQGLTNRKAIFSLFPQAFPNTRVIDKENCIFLTKGKCGTCEKVCPAGAIKYDDTEKEFELKVGAIILAPGLDRYDARVRGELGLGRWPNVVTSLQFERILSASGPFSGVVQRPSDNKHPQKVAWIQCVGSRDPHTANPWCSSVCCMYATKQSIIAKEHDSNVEPTIFYMELRAFGKDFDKYVDRAKNDYGVQYKRAMISAVREEPDTGNLILRYANEQGDVIDETFDLVVLSIGFEPHQDAVDFADTFGIELNNDNFAATTQFTPVETSRPGVYVTGTFQGPKDIPETVMQGSAVAGKAMSLISDARGTDITVRELPPEKETSGKETRTGVFVCRCGINISQTVDVVKVAEDVKQEPGVVYTEEMMYACAQDSQDKIKAIVKEQELNRVVVASCTPRTHEPLFQETIRDAGLNKYLFELADIREQCAWCHMGQNETATEKALDLVKMSIAKINLGEPIQSDSVSVTHAALIIGGGMAGITSSLALADQGFDVLLVEQDQEIGGLCRNVYRTLDGSDVQTFLIEKINEVKNNPRITIKTNAQVIKTDGFVGNFQSTLSDESTFDHGAIILSTGGIEYKPEEYLYGDDDRIITQRDLEKNLEKKSPETGERYVMIQCVGSREEPHNYCSRICCQDAIKNAITIKEKNPDAHVTILYRDIRTYGLREEYYEKARSLGVAFIHFEPEKKPEVTTGPTGLNIRTYDYVINRDIELNADYIILSTGLRPHPSTEKVGSMYKVTRNQDGFYLEAHVKLRPVDFPSEGIFVAGLGHAPKNLDETITQALAAAGRAGVLLSKERLGVSGVIAKHDRNICMSCLTCLRLCPFDSPYLDEEGKISHNEVKCMGCGICAGICPAKAFQINSFRDEQILSMIDKAVEMN
jgi:heterodisulfide reductase subunit A